MSEKNKTEEFLAHYNLQQGRLYAYIRTMIPNRDDAGDVFQEVCVALWKAFDQFEPGTSFAAWSRQIARYRVLAFHKRQGRDRHRFEAGVVEVIATEVEQSPEFSESLGDALLACLGKLAPKDRQLIERRYKQNCTTVALAKEAGMPVNTAYKALARIRRSLRACIRRVVAEEDRT